MTSWRKARRHRRKARGAFFCCERFEAKREPAHAPLSLRAPQLKSLFGGGRGYAGSGAAGRGGAKRDTRVIKLCCASQQSAKPAGVRGGLGVWVQVVVAQIAAAMHDGVNPYYVFKWCINDAVISVENLPVLLVFKFRDNAA